MRAALAVSLGAGVLLATAIGVAIPSATASSPSPASPSPATGVAPPIEARTPPISALLDQKRLLGYPFEQVWPSSVRYLRIDRGYKITERDPDAGFILFSFPVGPDSTGSGSVEMLRTTDVAGRPSVQLRIRTQAGPSHLPHTLLEGIAAKVRAERGPPPPPPPPDAPPAPPPEQDPDGGAPPMLPPATEPGQPPT